MLRDNGGMKVFVSSVRRGLEEERDALPGLVTAIGHSPIRFEDFSAQPLPSREACLAGIAAADVYLLILGPNYGHRFGDTGQSPTHEEWTAATAAGIPRLVYRKSGVVFDSDQEEFARRIGDYPSGVFYDTFATTAELLTKVAAKLREVEQSATPLTFSPIRQPVDVTWRSDFDDGPQLQSTTPTALELHVVPIDAQTHSARIMSDLAQVIPSRVRESGMIDASVALTTTRPRGAVVVDVPRRPDRWNSPREPQLLGVRFDSGGQASAWATLPGDSMGSVLDPTALPDQVADLLRLIGMLRVIEASQIAIGIGVDSPIMVTVDSVGRLPRQSASGMSMSDRPVRIAPDELVTIAALDVGALEVARGLSRELLERFQPRR